MDVSHLAATSQLLNIRRYVFLTLYPCSASTYPTPWAPSYLIPFFRRLLIAVHSIHQLNISHEDLKRSNVLVDDSGSPVLVDFGFSHFRPHGEKVKSAGGTLDYSSPEKSAVSSSCGLIVPQLTRPGHAV